MTNEDNGTITDRSQSDFNFNSPATQLLQFLSDMNKRLDQTNRLLARNQIDIDIHNQDYGGTGIVTLTDQIRTPMLITDIVATWATAIPGSSSNAEGSVTSPAANTVIASIAAPAAGAYQVYVTFNLAGTVTQGTDNNNIKLIANGATLATLDNTIQATEQIFGPFYVQANGSNPIQLQTVGAGTAGSIYSATITATEILPVESVTLTIADRILSPNPTTGEFILNGLNGMQVDIHQKLQLQVVPAAACHFTILGHADYRKIDRLS